MTDPNPVREYSAGIEPPEAFDPSTFRSIDLAPGVRAVIGKRPGKDTTEIQSIRFATKGRHSFDADMAKAWLRRNGYRWISWGSPFRKATNAPAPTAPNEPTPNRCAPASTNPPPLDRENLRAFAAILETLSDDLAREQHRLEGGYPYPDRTIKILQRAIVSLDDIARRIRSTVGPFPNDPDLGGLILASAVAGRALSDAAAKKNPPAEPAPAPPAPSAPAPAENPPAPRQLVQIGTARELELKSGRGYRWNVDERWLVLADPGAEKGSRGRIRLFIVAPRGKHPSKREPHKTSERTFHTWHNFDASRTWSMDVPLADEFTTVIGDAKSITYRSDKWQPGKQQDYIHSFAGAQLPRVSAVGPADRPRALMVDGGRFRLTARGLVD